MTYSLNIEIYGNYINGIFRIELERKGELEMKSSLTVFIESSPISWTAL